MGTCALKLITASTDLAGRLLLTRCTLDGSLQDLTSSHTGFKAARGPVLMSQDTVTAETSMPPTAVQAVHCIVQSGEDGTPFTQTTNKTAFPGACRGGLTQSWFPSVVRGPCPRVLYCPVSLTSSLFSSASEHCALCSPTILYIFHLVFTRSICPVNSS